MAALTAVYERVAMRPLLRSDPGFGTRRGHPGTRHGFHNDSTPRYDEAAANLAWERTVAFFKQHLG